MWHVIWPLLVAVTAALLVMLFRRPGIELNLRPLVDYSTFYGWVEADKVTSVVLDGTTLEGELETEENIAGTRTRSFRTVHPEADPALLPLLHAKKVQIRVAHDDSQIGHTLLVYLLPWVLIVLAWSWISRRTRAILPGGNPLDMVRSTSHRFEKSSAAPVTFNDIAGLESTKRDLQEVVQFLRDPERFQRLGGRVPRGVLLVGPPGTGKTLLARAVAGESGVPFFSVSASEFIEMFVGVGAARVRDLFEEAKRNEPAIVFIDEIDAVGRSRGAGFGGGHDEREQTLNQLLSELDGFQRNDLTVVLAATNRPDVLDPALLRPGRFDRRVLVERPELAARRAILGVHVRNKPLGKDVDLDAIAKNTPGFSGADLANLVNEAALRATRLGAESIGAADFADAYDKIMLGDLREAKLGPEERKRVAVHESGHALVSHLSSEVGMPTRVSIIPRGMALGVTQRAPTEDRHLMTKNELEARLRVLLGGYAAEQLVLGAASSGTENDLKEATQIASRMIAHFGMSELLGPAYYEYEEEHPFLGQRIATESGTSDETRHAIERETQKALARALEEASALLASHRAQLDTLIRALLEKEALDTADLRQLLGVPAPTAPTSVPALAAAMAFSR